MRPFVHANTLSKRTISFTFPQTCINIMYRKQYVIREKLVWFGWIFFNVREKKVVRFSENQELGNRNFTRYKIQYFSWLPTIFLRSMVIWWTMFASFLQFFFYWKPLKIRGICFIVIFIVIEVSINQVSFFDNAPDSVLKSRHIKKGLHNIYFYFWCWR